MHPFYMLSLSREKIYKGLGLRPIAYMCTFTKGLGPRLYAAKQLIWFRVTIFSLGCALHCSITSISLMWKQLQLIIPLFRRRWMSCFLREQLNHLLVVLVSIPACLLFLSILVAPGPCSSLSSLIVICIYLLLRCIISDMSGSLFSMMIVLSPLICRVLIYIFLLFSIIIIFYDLFGTMCLISGRFYLLGWL